MRGGLSPITRPITHSPTGKPTTLMISVSAAGWADRKIRPVLYFKDDKLTSDHNTAAPAMRARMPSDRHAG